MKTNFSINSAVAAGIVATTALTLFTFMAPLMGIEMDSPAMLAGTMGAPIIVGWLAHFMIGIVLAINFAALFFPNVSSENKIKSSILFSLIPWLMSQIVVMPMMVILKGGSYGDGLFSGSVVLAGASLMGHLLYGVVLGLVYKPKLQTEFIAQTSL